jgi:long-subunit fatty acid transport protein
MRRGAALAAALAALASPFVASAGNEDAYLIGAEAAMTGGAVAAVTRDSGAVWYNPAGLGGFERAKIDVSGTAFELGVHRMPDLVVTKLESGPLTAGINDVSIHSVPTAIVRVRNINDRMSFGVGIFVPQCDKLTGTSEVGASTTFRDLPGVQAYYRQRVALSWDRTAYHLGGALGLQLAPWLRVGLAVFLTVDLASERFFTLGEAQDVENPGDQHYSLRESQLDLTTLGFRAVLGLQADLSRRFSLGLSVRSAEVTFYQWGRRFDMTDVTPGLLEGVDAEVLSFGSRRLTHGNIDPVAPWRLNFAAAYRYAAGWVAAEIDVQAPLENGDLGIEQGWVTNVRLGAFGRLTERWALGGGLFTDLAGRQPPSSFGAWRVDFYGATLGAELRTPIEVRNRRGANSMIFTTSAAIRYAVGAGQFLGFSLQGPGGSPVASAGNPGFEPHLRDVVFHELALNIGSSLVF